MFRAALTALIAPKLSLVDPFKEHLTVGNVKHFDLVTFPEAFLPVDELLSALPMLSQLESLGCVHVGLRPTNGAADRHLIHVSEILQLVDSLGRLSEIARNDLAQFSRWLESQGDERLFNIGCLFTIDSERRLRICLHPKLIRSKFEASPIHEEHMAEANLLTLITLLPTDKELFSVTIQPLLCSDALQLDTDQPHTRPLDGVNTDAHCLGKNPPDHIDIVSIPTCSPQTESAGDRNRRWHPEFTDSFKRAASDDSLVRHHYAIFVLANFRVLRDSLPGGLSGIFMPLPVGSKYPNFVSISYYGRPKGAARALNHWSLPGEQISPGEEMSTFGHVTSLDPSTSRGPAQAYMLGFTVSRLPRDTTRWRQPQGLADFQLQVAHYGSNSAELIFGQTGRQND